MPIATTTQAGRAIMLGSDPRIEENASQKLARKRAEASRAAAALNGTPDEKLFADSEPTREKAKPAATFTIHALLDDFPFDVSFSGSAEQLAATVQRLRDLGAVPPTQAARAAVEAEKERSAPVCEFHGPMKESSKRPGTFYCPAKMGNGEYCKSKG
jgi:hypothetical protein